MRRIARHISAFEIDLSSFSSNQPDNAFQKGRFTGPIRADDRHRLIKFDPEINTAQISAEWNLFGIDATKPKGIG